MEKEPKYISTAEAVARSGFYGAYLHSLVGRTLSAPIRKGHKCYWLASEINAIAEAKRQFEKILI